MAVNKCQSIPPLYSDRQRPSGDGTKQRQAPFIPWPVASFIDFVVEAKQEERQYNIYLQFNANLCC